jgi:hypothetical protein
LLKKTVEGANSTSALNFTNPSFQDMQRFRGGNGETKQDDNNDVPIAVPINSDVNDKKREEPIATAPIAVPYAPDNYNESYNMSKIISAYEGTFAYAVYQLLDAEIKTIVKSDDPIAKIYKDLDQFRVPTLVKQNKNAIDYAKTMCSPGMMKKEMNRINTIKASAPPLPAPVNDENTTIEAYVPSLPIPVNYAIATPITIESATNNDAKNNDATNKGDASTSKTSSSWLNPFGRSGGGNTHKTYRKMTQKRHKYTRKT